jgi:hypothetical protein
MERKRLVLFAWLFGALGAYMFFIPFASTISLWIVVSLLAATSALPFLYELRGRENVDPLTPTMWLAPWFFTTYGLHALFRMFSQNYTFNGLYYGPYPPIPIFVDVVALSTLGLAALLIGYYSLLSKYIVERLPTWNQSWSARRAAISVIGLFFVGILGYLTLVPDIGTGPRSQLAKGSSQSSFILVNLVGVAAIIALSDAAINLSKRTEVPTHVFRVGSRKLRTRYPFRLLFAVLATLLAAGILWTLGGRGRAFRVFVVGVFLLHYFVRPFRFAEWVGIYTLIELTPAWSAEIASQLLSFNASGLLHVLRNPYFFKKVDWFAFNNVSVLVAGVPQHLGYQYGKTFLSAFFEPVSYQPLPEAHVVFGEALAPSIIVESFGVSLTMVGELYLNFSVVGVLVGFVLIGAGIRTFYAWTIRSGSTVVGPILFAAVANDFLMKGNFSNAAPSMGLILLPLLFTLAFITYSKS